MNPQHSDQDRPLSDRKMSERALVLLLVGCALLTPPLAGIFQIDTRILGIPFTGLYLFAVWAALIAGAALLSSRLQKSADRDSAEGAPPGEEQDSVE